MKHSKKRVSRGLTLAAGISSLALMLAGCAGAAASNGGAGGDSAGGAGVAFGADDAEWQTAFAEIDPIDLVWQSASSAASTGGERQQVLVERIADLSDGKIQIELVFGDAIAPNVEADEALADGRIDLHLLVPFLQPSDFPVVGQVMTDATSLRPSAYLSGGLVAFAALSEAMMDVPEIHEEYEQDGITVLAPIPTLPQSSLACSKPLTSLDDLAGKQIRVGPAGTYGQIEALGATPVSVAFADLYESLQRGIVDCLVIGTTTFSQIPGMVDLVPYIMQPVGTSFISTPGIMLAGPKWKELPLVAQQLIYDVLAEGDLSNQEISLPDGGLMAEQAAAVGGGFVALGDDVSTALHEYNEAHLDELRESALLSDASGFIDNAESLVDEWAKLVAEIGVSDAEASDLEGWVNTTPDYEAFRELYFDRVHVPNRPS